MVITMSCKLKRSTHTTRRKNKDDLTTKDLLDTTIKVGLLGVTVGLIDKMK